MRNRVYRKRSSDYLLPFLSIVGIGIIIIIAFQLFGYFKGKTGDVYFYIPQGDAKILTYGTSEWVEAFNGTKLLAGDSVKTLSNSKMVLQFDNGSVIRLDQNSALTLKDISKTGDSEKISVNLDYGSAWVNRLVTEDIKSSKFEVRSEHMLVKDVGSIIELEKGTESETVRVFKGSIKVDIFANEENKNEVADTKEVGVGQELHLDAATIKAFKNRENPSPLIAIRDDFKVTNWYSWNIAEDEKPTDFSKVQNVGTVLNQTSELNSTEQVPARTQMDISSTQTVQQTQSTQVANSNVLPKVTITSPTQPEVTITNGTLSISGNVSSGTAKIFVKQTLAGATEDYQLQKYKVGDTTFKYNISEAYGNLKPGDNTYVFYGVDVDGRKGKDLSQIVVHYNKEGAATQTQATPGSQTLTAPKVLSYNGTQVSEVTVGVVKIIGEVHGAEKVIVNGYALSKFVPGSSSWLYYANENGGNLNPGLNEYEVYAVDANGKESERVKFTITYKKAVTQTQSSSQTQTQSTP